LFADAPRLHPKLFSIWIELLLRYQSRERRTPLPITHDDVVYVWSQFRGTSHQPWLPTDAVRPIAALLAITPPNSRQWLWDQLVSDLLAQHQVGNTGGETNARITILNIVRHLPTIDDHLKQAIGNMVVGSLSHPSANVVQEAVTILAAWVQHQDIDLSSRAREIVLRIGWGPQAHPLPAIRWSALQAVEPFFGPMLATSNDAWHQVIDWIRHPPVGQWKMWAYRVLATWCPPYRLPDVTELLIDSVSQPSDPVIRAVCDAWNTLIHRFPDIPLPHMDRWIRTIWAVMESNRDIAQIGICFAIAEHLRHGLGHAWMAPWIVDHLRRAYHHPDISWMRTGVDAAMLRGPCHFLSAHSLMITLEQLVRSYPEDIVVDTVLDAVLAGWGHGYDDALCSMITTITRINKGSPQHLLTVVEKGIQKTGHPDLISVLMTVFDRCPDPPESSIHTLITYGGHHPPVADWVVNRIKREPSRITPTIARYLWNRHGAVQTDALITTIAQHHPYPALILAIEGWDYAHYQTIIDHIVAIFDSERHTDTEWDFKRGIEALLSGRIPLAPDTMMHLLLSIGNTSERRPIIADALRSAWGTPMTPYICPILRSFGTQTRGFSAFKTIAAITRTLASGWGHGEDDAILETLLTIGHHCTDIWMHADIIRAFRQGWGRGYDDAIIDYLHRIIHTVGTSGLVARQPVIPAIIHTISTDRLATRHQMDIVRAITTEVPDGIYYIVATLEMLSQSQ
jgi:hypothetical protein